MADATTADPTNAVEVAALLTEAAEAGTAVEAMRIVFSTTVGAQFAELLVQQLGYREPPTMSGADEVARLQSEVARLQEDTAAKDAAMEKVKRDQEWLEEGGGRQRMPSSGSAYSSWKLFTPPGDVLPHQMPGRN